MRHLSNVTWLVLALIAGPALVVSAGSASARASAGQGRLGPPAFVTCDRNHLTAFAGKVVSLTRGSDATTLRMETDEHTTERFTVRHPGADASAWFFLAGKPFTPADWTTVLPGGQLPAGARATVWVCADQANPKVDWAPPVQK